MIGIIGAMKPEVDLLISRLEGCRKQTVSGRDFHIGRLCGQDAAVVQGGVGKVNAAMCAEALILTFRPELVVNTGVAGSLISDLGVGDIAVARDLVQYDVDTSAVGDPVGLVSTVNRIEFPCAEWAVKGLLDAADRCGLKGRAARVASGDRFVADSQTKGWIARQFSGDVCEMEGCPIAQVCWVNGVDCAVIRAVSDSTDGEHAMEYGLFCEMAAKNSARILMGFLENIDGYRVSR